MTGGLQTTMLVPSSCFLNLVSVSSENTCVLKILLLLISLLTGGRGGGGGGGGGTFKCVWFCKAAKRWSRMLEP